VFHEGGEGGFRHGGMKTERAGGENFFVPADCFLRASFYSALGLNQLR
jgi:hypothetical protein